MSLNSRLLGLGFLASLVAAVPVPGIIALLCLFVFGNALAATIFDRESCGVDACAMAMGFSAIILFWTGVVYALGVATAASIIPRRDP